jgi:hypothetical protein
MAITPAKGFRKVQTSSLYQIAAGFQDRAQNLVDFT